MCLFIHETPKFLKQAGFGVVTMVQLLAEYQKFDKYFDAYDYIGAIPFRLSATAYRVGLRYKAIATFTMLAAAAVVGGSILMHAYWMSCETLKTDKYPANPLQRAALLHNNIIFNATLLSARTAVAILGTKD